MLFSCGTVCVEANSLSAPFKETQSQEALELVVLVPDCHVISVCPMHYTCYMFTVHFCDAKMSKGARNCLLQSLQDYYFYDDALFS